VLGRRHPGIHARVPLRGDPFDRRQSLGRQRPDDRGPDGSLLHGPAQRSLEGPGVAGRIARSAPPFFEPVGLGRVRPRRRTGLKTQAWSDLALARACARRGSAWEEFERRHFAFIRAFASRLLPGAAGADLADQVIADLWQRGKIARFEGRSNLKTWLGAVVAHAASNVAQARRRMVPLHGAGQEERIASGRRPEPAHGDRLGRERLAALLAEATARLDAPDRLSRSSTTTRV
jgi:DNA-directed RNA polymerase specialized sigma24 family protein